MNFSLQAKNLWIQNGIQNFAFCPKVNLVSGDGVFISESFMDSHDITEQESASLGTYDNLSSSKEIDYTHTNQYDVGIHQKPKSLKPLPVKCNDDDTFKIPSRNNSAALAVDKPTDLASRTYDLRTKLSKAANSSASPVPDSFSRKLDLFLKEIRQQTNSTF